MTTNRELADEIELYLEPDATYHLWEPSMEDMAQIITALRSEREPATEAVLEGLRNSPCGRLLQQELCLQDALVDANCEPCDCWRAALKEPR